MVVADTVPLWSPVPKGRALRLAGVMGLVAQIVITAFQWGTYLVQPTTATESLPPSTASATAVSALQLIAILVVLVAAWFGRRGVAIGVSLLLVALTGLRLAINLSQAGNEPRDVVAWVTAAFPMAAAALAVALGFYRSSSPITGRERMRWSLSSLVLAVVLSTLIVVGSGAPVPHAWTLLYAVMTVVLLTFDRVWARNHPEAFLQGGTTWRALVLLTLFMVPIQGKDIILPVNGRPPFWLALEVFATLMMAAVAWIIGAERDLRTHDSERVPVTSHAKR